MPLLLIPLLIVGVVLLWALLLPLSLIQRYRLGKARRRVVRWVATTNAWLVLLSVAGFVLGAWTAQRWLPDALPWSLGGLALGLLLGLLSLWTSRFTVDAGKLFVHPQAWLVLGLTVLVALRIALGLWQLWTYGWTLHPAVGSAPWWLHPHSLFGFGGLLLGHYTAWTWGLKARLRRHLPRP